MIMSASMKTIWAPFERYRLIRQTQDLFSLYSDGHMNNFRSYLSSMDNYENIKVFIFLIYTRND